MNVRTALISSALLLAVLGWACEQQGPSSPSALGTPGGGSLGGVSLDAAGGAILGVKPDCPNDPSHPSCDEEPPEDDRQLYKVTVERTDPDHISSFGSGVTRAGKGGALIVGDLTLNLPFFVDRGLTERDGTPCDIGAGRGGLAMMVPSADPDRMNVGFNFLHKGTQHRIGLLGTVPAIWQRWTPIFGQVVKVESRSDRRNLECHARDGATRLS